LDKFCFGQFSERSAQYGAKIVPAAESPEFARKIDRPAGLARNLRPAGGAYNHLQIGQIVIYDDNIIRGNNIL